jgi:subtilase family serine protease
VAIVDAYDDPTAEADLATYRSYFGLPACTTANGCFKKINQSGGTSYPRANGGWAQEISLDIDMVSAICPNCHILLVEASSASFANLGTAVNTAAASGATAISNSYGGSDASDATYGAYYNHPGIAVTVSSGDNGYGAEYPASSHYVTAVGGTTLSTASNSRGWTETAWSGAGSGCSTFNTILSGQSTAGTGCATRAVADVSAVADPATGVSVYDSTRYLGKSGWLTFGGTSVSSPIIASVFALAGNSASIDNNYPYTHSGSLFDVTSGSNGSCPTSQWCTARAGWDGPTGLGTPNGVGAF